MLTAPSSTRYFMNCRESKQYQDTDSEVCWGGWIKKKGLEQPATPLYTPRMKKIFGLQSGEADVRWGDLRGRKWVWDGSLAALLCCSLRVVLGNCYCTP